MAKTTVGNPAKQILKRLFETLIGKLKGAFVKKALKKIFGSVIKGGFKVWLVTFILEELYENVAEPLIRLAARKGLLIYDKIDGKIKIKKMNKALKEGDEDTYNDILDNV